MVSGTTRFGRNQIYLKLMLGARQFMPGIKNLNLIFFEFQTNLFLPASQNAGNRIGRGTPFTVTICEI
jgi:hypothetical protein